MWVCFLDVFFWHIYKAESRRWKRRFCSLGSESEDACGLTGVNTCVYNDDVLTFQHNKKGQICCGRIRAHRCCCKEKPPPLTSKHWLFSFLLVTYIFWRYKVSPDYSDGLTHTHIHSSEIGCTDLAGSRFRCCAQLMPVPAPASSAGSVEKRQKRKTWICH